MELLLKLSRVQECLAGLKVSVLVALAILEVQWVHRLSSAWEEVIAVEESLFQAVVMHLEEDIVGLLAFMQHQVELHCHSFQVHLH